MIDLLWFYCVFSYLFTLGLTFSCWDDLEKDQLFGSIVCLILAPISLPIVMGVIFYGKNR